MVEYKVTVEDGVIKWHLHNKLHRDGGPAVEYPDGSKCWYKHGERNRDDGPAVVCANGLKFWFINGNELTEEEFNERTNIDGITFDVVDNRQYPRIKYDDVCMENLLRAWNEIDWI